MTLWETYTFGQQPYGDMSGGEATDLVAQGARLPQPPRCPNDIYSVMQRCWSFDPENRPTFANLVRHFASNAEYDNIQNLIQSTEEPLRSDSVMDTSGTSDA